MDKSITSGSSVKINAASIVELKAELYKKQKEFKEQKSKNLNTETTSGSQEEVTSKPKWLQQSSAHLRAKKKAKENSGNFDNSLPDHISEEEQSLQKSRAALERKADLYNKLKSGNVDFADTEDKPYLVDFERKYYNEAEERAKVNEALREKTPPPVDANEEWVEFVDGLGRSRKCMKKDLPTFKAIDKDMRIESSSSSHLTLLSDDMRREMLRQKWEQEEKEAAEKPVGSVHYENVKFDEVRDMGVGYYRFSTDEAKRQEQFQRLNKLRDQTTDQRLNRQQVKAKRKAMLEARLAKVKLRKGIPLKIGVISNDDEKEDAVQAIDDGSRTAAEHKDERSAKTISISQDKIDENRTQEYKIRKYDPSSERPAEFAPPAEYFDTKPVSERKWKHTGNRQDLYQSPYEKLNRHPLPPPTYHSAPPPFVPPPPHMYFSDSNQASYNYGYSIPSSDYVKTNLEDSADTTDLNEATNTDMEVSQRDIEELISYYRVNSSD